VRTGPGGPNRHRRHDGERGYHPGVDPQLLIVAGFVALAAGVLVLLSFGSGYRLGRLLAAAPVVPIAAAVAAAGTGRAGYVGVEGRIDSAEPFADAADRPLVFRRTRIELRRRGRWLSVEDSREAVPFTLREGLDEIAVDTDVLGPGVVVLPRESTGVAADLPDRVPAGTALDTPARAVIQQISAVEHALALGVPTLRPDGSVVLTAGTGRPLVVSTLERDEAMRVLAGGGRWRAIVVAVLLGIGVALLIVGLVWASIQGLAG
jgi:hypothetical protein